MLVDEYGDGIEHCGKVAAQMYQGLSEACVSAAGVPFSMGDAAACDQILTFAGQMYGNTHLYALEMFRD